MPSWLRWTVGILALLAVTGWAAFRFSPWPGALLIRIAFDRDAVRANAALAPLVPPGTTTSAGVRYDPADPDAILDVYFPPGADSSAPLPVVVWIHGGAWISGSRSHIANYARLIAARGYVVVSVDYSIAPGARYPTPVRQTAAALAFLRGHAAEFHLDPDRIFLAGDSAGGHIAAQLAALITSPSYAGTLAIPAPIPARSLRGVLLFCGAYDPEAVNLDGPFGGFLRAVLWAYSGTREFRTAPDFASATVRTAVDGAFPPAFLTVGNADPLAPQTYAMARTLAERGVTVDTLYFPASYTPPLGHEYQFHLEGDAGRLALARATDFLARH